MNIDQGKRNHPLTADRSAESGMHSAADAVSVLTEKRRQLS
jgi:hypothetical protein